MIQNKEFEIWWNAKGLDPNHPLRWHFQKFSFLGADLDVIFALCRMLVLANFVQSQLLETKRRLAHRKRRWRKEFRGLVTSHPGGKLRLTECARSYTDNLISWTLTTLKRKGLDLPNRIEISIEEKREIIAQALGPFANINGFPEDWDAAINELSTSNLPQIVGLSKVTPEEGELVKRLISVFLPSIFLNKGTKRRDDHGSMFLLLVTEHVRERKKGKPHFNLAFNLMRSLSGKTSLGKTSRPIGNAGRNAKSRVYQLKKRWPQWQTQRRQFEQMVQASKASLALEKVN